MYHGNADGIRVHQVPLPYIGSWGLVCFPYGDDRFPIWMGAYYPNVVNAITSSSALDDSQTDYYSHASGLLFYFRWCWSNVLSFARWYPNINKFNNTRTHNL